ncbi:hypothetical protein NDU88_002084 [Pleurodeles waltl]|uniref:Uncharacterized protein n=1 Tax=Pleurodeles waltl TaxID=8319 RepID=A0AAV7MWE2_PLEWA|nr:hypothetical protein NDU88_002084 [Pleurodeles waltl]
MCPKSSGFPGKGPTSNSGVQREYVGPQEAQPGKSRGPPSPVGETPRTVGVQHEHPQERWRDVQRTQPSNSSGGPSDPEAGHAHDEGRALAQIHPGSIGSSWGTTVGVLCAAPLSAHLAGAGALKGPPSAGAASAQRQAAPSRPRPRWFVRGTSPPQNHQPAVSGASRPPPDNATLGPRSAIPLC